MNDVSGAVSLSDGRVIAYLDGGDPQGFPIFGLHGTPGCRLSRWPDDNVYADAGIRYITTDRAGYGQSSRHRGRIVVDDAADVLAVADALHIKRFSVVGGSGGGPHALACAAVLKDRIVKVACQSGIAPLGDEGMNRDEWVAGMTETIAAELIWAEAGEDVLTKQMRVQQAAMEAALISNPSMMFGEGMSEKDEAFMLRPQVIETFRRIVTEQARHGVWGSVDDTLAFAQPWGFELTDIHIPALITHGALDASAPLAHGMWLAERIPSAEVQISKTGGHMPEEPEIEIVATMSWLRG